MPQRKVQGMLLKTLVPKHPEHVMHTPHATEWLQFMCEAADETIEDGLISEAVLRFALHFLAFFDFTPASLCEQRAVVDDWLEQRESDRRDLMLHGHTHAKL